MAELAFDVNGDGFDLPAGARGWRVRRVMPQASPAVVYGRRGIPLFLPLGGGIAALHAEVSEPGRYRLDPVDDCHRQIAGAPSAYVMVAAKRGGEVAELPPAGEATAPTDLVLLREAHHTNAAMVEAIVSGMAPLMDAAATVLRAASGLPAECQAAPASRPAPAPKVKRPASVDLAAIVAQVAPLVIAMIGEVMKSDGAEAGQVDEVATAAAVAATISPAAVATLAPIAAVVAKLSPVDRAIVGKVVEELAPSHRRAWFGELRALPVPDAVARVQRLVGAGLRNGAGPATPARGGAARSGAWVPWLRDLGDRLGDVVAWLLRTVGGPATA
jgi:hypothetical protein